MNRFVLFLVGIVFAVCVGMSMSGCSIIEAKMAKDVQTVTIPDLQAAVADAQAANDQDGVDCWTEILKYVQSLPSTAANTTAPKIAGVASGIEAARIAANQPKLALPPVPHSLHKACSVLVVDSQQLALKLGLDFAALKSSVGVAEGAAKVKAGERALKAAEAAMAPHP